MGTATHPNAPALPLASLLVVSMEQAVDATEYAVRLANAGARVIEIECAERDFAVANDMLARSN